MNNTATVVASPGFGYVVDMAAAFRGWHANMLVFMEARRNFEVLATHAASEFQQEFAKLSHGGTTREECFQRNHEEMDVRIKARLDELTAQRAMLERILEDSTKDLTTAIDNICTTYPDIGFSVDTVNLGALFESPQHSLCSARHRSTWTVLANVFSRMAYQGSSEQEDLLMAELLELVRRNAHHTNSAAGFMSMASRIPSVTDALLFLSGDQSVRSVVNMDQVPGFMKKWGHMFRKANPGINWLSVCERTEAEIRSTMTADMLGRVWDNVRDNERSQGRNVLERNGNNTVISALSQKMGDELLANWTGRNQATLVRALRTVMQVSAMPFTEVHLGTFAFATLFPTFFQLANQFGTEDSDHLEGAEYEAAMRAAGVKYDAYIGEFVATMATLTLNEVLRQSCGEQFFGNRFRPVMDNFQSTYSSFQSERINVESWIKGTTAQAAKVAAPVKKIPSLVKMQEAVLADDAVLSAMSKEVLTFTIGTEVTRTVLIRSFNEVEVTVPEATLATLYRDAIMKATASWLESKVAEFDANGSDNSVADAEHNFRSIFNANGSLYGSQSFTKERNIIFSNARTLFESAFSEHVTALADDKTRRGELKVGEPVDPAKGTAGGFAVVGGSTAAYRRTLQKKGAPTSEGTSSATQLSKTVMPLMQNMGTVMSMFLNKVTTQDLPEATAATAVAPVQLTLMAYAKSVGAQFAQLVEGYYAMYNHALFGEMIRATDKLVDAAVASTAAKFKLGTEEERSIARNLNKEAALRAMGYYMASMEEHNGACDSRDSGEGFRLSGNNAIHDAAAYLKRGMNGLDARKWKDFHMPAWKAMEAAGKAVGKRPEIKLPPPVAVIEGEDMVSTVEGASPPAEAPSMQAVAS